MTSRQYPTGPAARNRGPSRPNKVNDENFNPTVTFGGPNPLRGKPSVKDLANAGVGGKKVQSTVVGAKEDLRKGGEAFKAGTKRSALGSISSNGFKDPHVDMDIPLKATRLTAKSRSPSAGAPTQTIDNVVKGYTVNPATTRQPLTTSSSTSAVVSSSRPTAPLPKHGASRSIASTSELFARETMASGSTIQEEDFNKQMTSSTSYELGGMHGSEDASMHGTAAKVKSRESGLTPSIGDLGVIGHGQEFDVSRNMGGLIDGGSTFSGAMGRKVHDVDVVHEDLEEDLEEEEEEEEDDDDWLRLSPGQADRVEETLTRIRDTFQDEVDMFDTTMVAEYAEDIFHYMSELEESVMPNPHYMEHQTEIEWGMRATLIDWLLQVHLRYHMLPETLWIAVNMVDRFLSQRVVSLVKLQLVGVTAMFVAAKYEEILAPSVDEFVYMTENGYTKDEILKGERIILQTLNFEISSYCSPYSWVRKISKADDYDIQTRTLSKFLMEVTLLDHRFLRAKPSMIAAIGMYLARLMLDGDWSEAFVYYSNYTDVQLHPGAQILCEQLGSADFDKQYVYKKYSNKKFLRASTFARDWATSHDIGSEGFSPSLFKGEGREEEE